MKKQIEARLRAAASASSVVDSRLPPMSGRDIYVAPLRLASSDCFSGSTHHISTTLSASRRTPIFILLWCVRKYDGITASARLRDPRNDIRFDEECNDEATSRSVLLPVTLSGATAPPLNRQD